MAENGAGGDAEIKFEAEPFKEFVSKLYAAWKVAARARPGERRHTSVWRALTESFIAAG